MPFSSLSPDATLDHWQKIVKKYQGYIAIDQLSSEKHHPYLDLFMLTPCDTLRNSPKRLIAQGQMVYFVFGKRPQPGTFSYLPEPSFPFGIEAPLSGREIKELSRFRFLRELRLIAYRDLLVGCDETTMHKLQQLQSLSVQGREVSEGEFQAFFSIKTLKFIDISNTSISGYSMKLAPWGCLERFRACNTPFTDQGLAGLAHCQCLQVLDLRNTKITDAGLFYLSRLPLLRTLYLNNIDTMNNDITDKGLYHLRKLPHLQALYLNKTAVTGVGLSYIPNLELLNLGNCPVTDAGIEKITSLKKLRWLSLDGTLVTDAGLLKLIHIPTLEVVDLVNCQHVTPEGIAQLQRQRPDLWIITGFGEVYRLRERRK
jgi:hypothetical protein